jgi:rod shape-determining protein MreB
MRLAAEMLREFLARVGIKGAALRRVQVLLSVPCGASTETLSEYALLAEECGIRKYFFVEQPYLAALGGGAVLSDFDPVFCIDVGGGVTNIAVVSADGIISGLSMNVGGNNMDANVMDKIGRQYGLKIGTLTAERIKNEIGTLAEPARGAMVAEGSSAETGRPTSVSVQASDLSNCIRVYIDKVVEYAGVVLRQLPAEVAAIVNRKGVYLSGGVMKIPFVPQYVGAKLEMRYHVCEEPQYATVLGGGAVVRDKDLLAVFAKEND